MHSCVLCSAVLLPVVVGNSFAAVGISFYNPVNTAQAIALLVASDKAVFWNCHFRGYQVSPWCTHSLPELGCSGSRCPGGQGKDTDMIALCMSCTVSCESTVPHRVAISQVSAFCTASL